MDMYLSDFWLMVIVIGIFVVAFYSGHKSRDREVNDLYKKLEEKDRK